MTTTFSLLLPQNFNQQLNKTIKSGGGGGERGKAASSQPNSCLRFTFFAKNQK